MRNRDDFLDDGGIVRRKVRRRVGRSRDGSLSGTGTSGRTGARQRKPRRLIESSIVSASCKTRYE
jgi:hypothetical protein